jgi:hypothetical protein
LSSAQSRGNASFPGVGSRFENISKNHHLNTFPNAQEGERGYSQDVESGKIKVVTILEQESEAVCDKSDMGSDRKLVAPGFAF